MTAGTHNITIEQGATFTLALTWKDANGVAVDLTGYTARLQCRETADAPAAFLDLSTAGGHIALGGAAGTVAVTAPAAATAAIAKTGGVYDLLLTAAGGAATRLLQGKVTVTRGVTR